MTDRQSIVISIPEIVVQILDTCYDAGVALGYSGLCKNAQRYGQKNQRLYLSDPGAKYATVTPSLTLAARMASNVT